MATATAAPRSRFRFLQPDDEIRAAEVNLDYFGVTLPEFKPAADESPLDDGEAPTRLGARFRQLFAEVHGISEDAVPHGLIRYVEAMSADHDLNTNRMASSYEIRNHAGTQVVVRFRAHTPLVGGALINGRMLSRVGRKLKGLPVVTTASDEVAYAPTINLVNGDHPYRISQAQKEVEGLGNYQGSDQDFIDSLALEGIVTAPVVALFRLADEEGREAFLSQTDDGWRRTTASRTALSELLGVDADLTYRHWRDADGGFTIRSHDAESIRMTLEALRFDASRQSGLLFPNGRTAKSIGLWRGGIADLNPDVRAFHRLRTVEIELVLAMRPLGGRTQFDVFYADMAGRHVPGLNAKDWSKASVEGVVAVRAIDSLVDGSHGVNAAERDAWLGIHDVPQEDTPDATPFRNRVVAGTALLAALTTDTRRYAVTYQAVKEHGLAKSPKSAATVAAAQTIVVFHVDGSGQEGQVSSTLMSLLMHASLYAEDRHGSSPWYDLIHDDLGELHKGAIAEMENPVATLDVKVGEFGPHQRALMALAGVAHITNPVLLEDDASFTRTGRGGRDGVGKADPINILHKMVRSAEGLERCVEIVEAAAAADPRVPVDAGTGEKMTETWLRRKYLAGPDDGGGTSGGASDDPLDGWDSDVNLLFELAEELQAMAKELEVREVDRELLGLEKGQEHPGDVMITRYGIPRGNEIVGALAEVSRIAAMGGGFHSFRTGGAV